jgi:hypothetical protein
MNTTVGGCYCINDTDEDGICDDMEIVGCTEITACNYDADATEDNMPDLCIYDYGICETCVDGEIVDNDTDDDTVCDNMDVCAGYDDTVDSDGDGTPDGCDDLSIYEGIIPEHYNISSIYPNPFNPTTTISFSIPEFGFTTITAYDITGRQLETLTNEVLSIGNYSINWNASPYPSGIYLIRMDSGEFTQTQKVVLVK